MISSRTFDGDYTCDVWFVCPMYVYVYGHCCVFAVSFRPINRPGMLLQVCCILCLVKLHNNHTFTFSLIITRTYVYIHMYTHTHTHTRTCTHTHRHLFCFCGSIITLLLFFIPIYSTKHICDLRLRTKQISSIAIPSSYRIHILATLHICFCARQVFPIYRSLTLTSLIRLLICVLECVCVCYCMCLYVCVCMCVLVCMCVCVSYVSCQWS